MSLYRILRGEIVSRSDAPHPGANARRLDCVKFGGHTYTVYDVASGESSELWIGGLDQAVVLWLYGQWQPEYALTIEEARNDVARRQQLATEFS